MLPEEKKKKEESLLEKKTVTLVEALGNYRLEVKA